MYLSCLFAKTFSTILLVGQHDNISSQSNIILCFFTMVRVNVTLIELIIKPKYSISWHGKNIGFDGWTINTGDVTSLIIFMLLEYSE